MFKIKGKIELDWVTRPKFNGTKQKQKKVKSEMW